MNAMSSMAAIGGLNGMEGGASVNFSADPPEAPALARQGRDAHASLHQRRGCHRGTGIAGPRAQKFELAVADSLQDYLGVQMAPITDCALARGWEPVSFLQKDGFRVYRYEAMRSYKGRKRGR